MSKLKKKFSNKVISADNLKTILDSDTTNQPAVSVIIPMYNVENFISATLNSLIKQTFQDFEVVIVDDCSTDKSIETAKSFSEKFGERLRIFKRGKNAGAAALPRNDSIKLARGKYITFLDSDDFLTPVALEILYKNAEKYNADVIHVEDSLVPAEGILDKDIDSNTAFKLWQFQKKPSVKEATVITDDIAERVAGFCRQEYIWWACNKLFRRKFIIDNKIEFPDMKVYEDMIFLFKCLCLAKTYVRIPDIIYIYRRRTGSMSQILYTVEGSIKKDLHQLINGVKHFDEFMSNLDLFNKNIQLKYNVFDLFVSLQSFNNLYVHCDQTMIDKMIRSEIFNNLNESPSFITYCIHKIYSNMKR